MADQHNRAGYRCSRTVDIEECIAAKDLTTLRLAVARNGYRPVPISGPTMKVNAAGKRPLMKNWPKICADADEAEIARWTEAEPKRTNTGLLCGELVGIDVDVLAPDLVEKIIAIERSMLGGTPLVRIGKAPKTLLCYRAAARFTKMETPELFFVDGSKAQIEILAEGQQFVAYGIHPDTLRPYEWLHGGPDTMPWADLPVVTEEACRRFVAEAEAILRAAGGRTKAEIKGKATKTGVAQVRRQGHRFRQGEPATARSSGRSTGARSTRSKRGFRRSSRPQDRSQEPALGASARRISAASSKKTCRSTQPRVGATSAPNRSRQSMS